MENIVVQVWENDQHVTSRKYACTAPPSASCTIALLENLRMRHGQGIIQSVDGARDFFPPDPVPLGRYKYTVLVPIGMLSHSANQSFIAVSSHLLSN